MSVTLKVAAPGPTADMRSVLARNFTPSTERRARAELEARATTRDIWVRWSVTFGALTAVFATISPTLAALSGTFAVVALRLAWRTGR